MISCVAGSRNGVPRIATRSLTFAMGACNHPVYIPLLGFRVDSARHGLIFAFPVGRKRVDFVLDVRREIDVFDYAVYDLKLCNPAIALLDDELPAILHNYTV